MATSPIKLDPLTGEEEHQLRNLVQKANMEGIWNLDLISSFVMIQRLMVTLDQERRMLLNTQKKLMEAEMLLKKIPVTNPGDSVVVGGDSILSNDEWGVQD